MICTKCNGTGGFTGHQKSTSSDWSMKCAWCMGTGAGVPLVKYAGIGSRETPEHIMQQMGNIAMTLALRGFILRSGAAKGADKAFEAGCDMVRGLKVIRTSTQYAPALEHASRYHPNWDACDDTARGLHARNSQIMLGDWFDEPVRFVVCWTPNGAVTGGTGQALRIADAMGIPVFNLWHASAQAQLMGWLDAGQVVS